MAGQQMEFTHAAVAAYVRVVWQTQVSASRQPPGNSGSIVRLLTEDYFFVCRRAFLETEPIAASTRHYEGNEFHKAVAALPVMLQPIPVRLVPCGIPGQRLRKDSHFAERKELSKPRSRQQRQFDAKFRTIQRIGKRRNDYR